MGSNESGVENNNYRHGQSNSSTYVSWEAMRSRCSNPKNNRYKNYGGRGIKVCERWHTFENFLADMGGRPEGTSLDRYPDKDGDYTPANCRWATSKEQNNNRRDNIPLTVYGKTFSIPKWADISGTHVRTIAWRNKQGWPDKEAVFGRAAS